MDLKKWIKSHFFKEMNTKDDIGSNVGIDAYNKTLLKKYMADRVYELENLNHLKQRKWTVSRQQELNILLKLEKTLQKCLEMDERVIKIKTNGNVQFKNKNIDFLV